MKLLLISLLLVSSTSLFSQQYTTALGIRGSWSSEDVAGGDLTLKHFFDGSNAFEANLGFGRRYVWFQGLYMRNFYLQRGWDWYIGAGGDFGYWNQDYRRVKTGEIYDGFWAGLDANAGLEYTFDTFPLNVSFDLGPTLRTIPYVRLGVMSRFAVRFVLNDLMLSPGAKGWISKYFDLIEKGEIKVSIRNYESLSDRKHLHLTYSRAGIVFGLPTRMIFTNKLETEKWTSQERLKFALLESLLFAHLKAGGELNKEVFIHRLLAFYGDHHNARSIVKTITFFLKEGDEEKLDNILSKRVDIQVNLLSNKWWMSSLTNVFVYLDVILFNDFVTRKSQHAINKYSDFAKNALIAITLMSYADGFVDGTEKEMFNHFLVSANLPEEHKSSVLQKFKDGASMEDLDGFVHRHWLLKRFLLDVAVLTAYASLSPNQKDIEFIEEFRKYLKIPKSEVEETVMFIENFIIENRNNNLLLKDSPSYEKAYSSFTERWRKILWRNKDKLATELKESKELVGLIKKSMSEDLSPEEKEKVKKQLKDILKSMPAFAVFMIPGGSILLPMMVKILPDLLPSAFKENEIDE